MTYSIELTPIAQTQLKEVPARFRWRVAQLINNLANEPYPAKSTIMRDPLTKYARVPLDRWRVIYEVQEEEQLIIIHRILLKQGAETYEDLELE